MSLAKYFTHRYNWILILSGLFFINFSAHAELIGAKKQIDLSLVKIGTMHLKMRPVDAKVLFRKDRYDRSSFAVGIQNNDGELQQGRVEVSGSFSRHFPKKNILIKLEKGQEWQGQRKISLDAMATDGSMQREWLVWQLVHALGTPGPQLNYVRLYINDEYRGLFMHTEWLEPQVMARYGLGADGQFFHPSDSKFCGDFLLHKKKPLDVCWFKLSPRDQDFSPLQTLVEELGQIPVAEFHNYLETHFDVDSVINWLVLNVLTSNGDSYNKNYFLYQSEITKKWVVIPWDYDLSFGRNWDAHLPFPKDVLNDNFQYFYPPELGAPNPLKEKTLRNSVLNKRFIERMLHLLGEEQHGPNTTFGWFSPESMHKRIRDISIRFQHARIDDPYLINSQINFMQETESLWHYVQRRHAYLRTIFKGEMPWDPELAIWDPADAPLRTPLRVILSANQKIPNKGQYSVIAAPAYGYLLAAIKLKDNHGPAEFSVESEIKHTPTFVPHGYDPSSCIPRNWFLTLRTPFQSRVVDLQLDYIQEDSKRQEWVRGELEEDFELWVLDGERWHKLEMRMNPLSNVISVANVIIKPSQMLRFVACSGFK